MPVWVLLTTAGNHVPLIPLVDIDDKIGAELPLQIAFSIAKEGKIFAVTVCVSVVGTAHWFEAGVKVYVPLCVLLTVAGVHFPLIPLFEVLDKIGAVLPLQISFSIAKDGDTFPVIVCVSVVAIAHWFAVGVKV